ncbi:MAG: HD domain-containing phosphohydrolase, partial [Planctomycetota bacterium]
MSKQPQTRIQLLDQLVEIAHILRDLEAKYEKSQEEQLVYEEHEELFQTIFKKANDGVAIVQEGTIVLANPKMSEIVGIPLQELIGSEFQQYIHPDLLTEALRKYKEHLAGKHISVVDRIPLLKKDGRQINIEFIAARITFEGKDAILYILTDVTYIKIAEEELVRLRQYKISFVEHVNIWLDILDESGNVVIWNKAAEEISGYSKEEVIGNAKIWEYLYPDKSYRDEIFSKAISIIRQGESVQAFETNILTRDGQKKIISWYSRDLFDDSGHTIGSIAIGLDVTALRQSNEALSHANQALRLAYDQTIEGWSRALDLRDKETEGHSQRVTEMTLRLARLAGMGEAELVDVRRGALLHDIGKMGVPDSILLKPDKLNDEEWSQMRNHPEYGYMLLSPIEFLRSALDIPYCHHEKWDGTGYPRGLKGEEIPLAARLFAVVDIYDAIHSARPYRKAWSTEQAIEYIKSLAGTHL